MQSQALTIERNVPVSKGWISQTLLVKTSISEENAAKVADSVYQELAETPVGITRNLVSALICVKLAENNLYSEQKEYVRTKVFYHDIDSE